jgi:hypothetical protein
MDPFFSILQGRQDPGSGSASKNSSIFYPKPDSKFSKITSGMFIPDPVSGFFSIPDQGVRKHQIPDPQH